MLESLRDVLLAEDSVVHLSFVGGSGVVLGLLRADLEHLLHDLLHASHVLCSATSCDETEHCAFRQRVHALALEEIGDVLDVHTQELQTARVVVLDTLADVDHDELVLVVEQVVLAQIGVHEAAGLVHDAHIG